jgi:hypothetical protein
MIQWDEMTSTVDIDNALVDMKDRIYRRIREASHIIQDEWQLLHPQYFQEIMNLFYYTEQVWIVHRYQYKAIEILNLMRGELVAHLPRIHHRAMKQHQLIADLIKDIDYQLQRFGGVAS